MARKRFVSPTFYSHAELYDAEVASGLPLRLGFQGLWCHADRRGLFAWRPRELKLGILPYDPCDFGAVLDALERYGFILSYVVNGKKYGFIPTLTAHQSFHQAEKPDRTIPDPPPGAFDHKTAAAPPQHGASTVPAPEEHRACSTVAVAVAVTGTTTVTAAATVGDSAPGQHHPATIAGNPESIGHIAPTRVPVGPAFADQYQLLADAALPYQRAALDAILTASPMPDIVVGSIHAIATGMHEVVSDKGEKAGAEHVMLALTEAVTKFFAGGRPFDQALFRGCVRRVVNRKPEPTTADQRASEDAIRRAAPHLLVESPRTAEEQAVSDSRRRASMRKFYLEAGRPDRAAMYDDPPAEAA